MATQLPNNQGPPLVAALKAKGTATFVLQPDTPTSTGSAGPFTSPGSHFRVRGLRAYLLGVTSPVQSPAAGAQPAVLQPISLTIATSGVYADVRDGRVFGFTMLPLSRLFRYTDSAGAWSDASRTIITDSFITSAQHVDPTPFTQWTITVRGFGLAGGPDLARLEDVKLVWEGTARFES